MHTYIHIHMYALHTHTHTHTIGGDGVQGGRGRCGLYIHFAGTGPPRGTYGDTAPIYERNVRVRLLLRGCTSRVQRVRGGRPRGGGCRRRAPLSRKGEVKLLDLRKINWCCALLRRGGGGTVRLLGREGGGLSRGWKQSAFQRGTMPVRLYIRLYIYTHTQA